MNKRLAFALLALSIAGCAARLRSAPPYDTAPAGSVQELAAAIAADSKRSDHESDSQTRSDLAAAASRDAAACLAREPHAVACLYGRALALGLEARAHPAHAGELLTTMLGTLESSEGADPDYDEAGPARVRALVLLRAPGWPLGPGDAEAGLAAAKRAASLRPAYPGNLLALAEALAKTGDSNGAQQTYGHALDAAQALPSSPERDDWLRQATEGLRRR